MKISMIVAMTDERVIGIKNALPWKLPQDMKWFRRQTVGKPIVMGRKTYESFGAKPLPDRLNIVVSHDKNYHSEGAVVVHTVDEALSAAGNVEEVMIIGGASFYAQLLPRADRLYITYVHTQVNGDAWFPAFELKDWRQVEQTACDADEKNPHPVSFVILDRLI